MAVLQQRGDEEIPAAPLSGSLRVDTHTREQLLAGWDPFCVTGTGGTTAAPSAVTMGPRRHCRKQSARGVDAYRIRTAFLSLPPHVIKAQA
jgi:hypothetical protein